MQGVGYQQPAQPGQPAGYQPQPGQPVGYQQPMGYQPQPGQAPYGAAPAAGVSAASKSAKTKAIAALVIGIVAIVLCWVPFLNILAGIASIVGTVISFQAMKALPQGADGRGLAIAGLACCICGIVFNLCLAACYGCTVALVSVGEL